MSPRNPGVRSRPSSRLAPLLATVLALIASLAVVAGARADAVPPTAVTGAATAITSTEATLTGTVNTADWAEYGFDYGASTAYGQMTATVRLPTTLSGPVQIRLSDLSPGTTYHYRVFAKNDAGSAQGDDATFTTAAASGGGSGGQAPTITTLDPAAITLTGATLGATVNPRGQPTTLRFEWGTTTGYGNAWDDAGVGAGTSDVTRTATIGGLTAGVVYHYRVAAKNASGITYSKDATFRASRGLTRLSAELSSTTFPWAGSVLLGGRLLGTVPYGVRLEVLRLDYPYKGGYKRLATTTTLDDGTWELRLKQIFTSTRLRVRVIDEPAMQSPTLKLAVAVQVPFVRGKRSSRSQKVRGAVYPVLKKATVVIQRKTSSGKWVKYKKAKVKRTKSGRIAFKLTIPRGKKDAEYRAYVDPRDKGAHAKTASEPITVPAR